MFRWTFNPAVLTKVSGPVGLSDAGNNLSPNGVVGLDSGHHFSVGDLVQICSDMERMKVRKRNNIYTLRYLSLLGINHYIYSSSLVILDVP